MAFDASGRWRVAAASDLHWRHWDDEFVVFNTASGQTHLLNPLGATALRLLETPLSVESLCEHLAEVHSIEIDAELQRAVYELVQEMDRIGLIDPA
jgi:PqqD family protein of HPr-rel-A system